MHGYDPCLRIVLVAPLRQYQTSHSTRVGRYNDTLCQYPTLYQTPHSRPAPYAMSVPDMA
eukprot:271680-Rhodomonas_salina.1